MLKHRSIKLILPALLFLTYVKTFDNLNIQPSTTESHNTQDTPPTQNNKKPKHATAIQKKSCDEIKKEYEPLINLSILKNTKLFKDYDHYANPEFKKLVAQGVGYEDFVLAFCKKIESKSIRKEHRKSGKHGGLHKKELINYFAEEAKKIEASRKIKYETFKNSIINNWDKIEQWQEANQYPEPPINLDENDKYFLEICSTKHVKLLMEANTIQSTFDQEESINIMHEMIGKIAFMASNELIKCNITKSINLLNLSQALLSAQREYAKFFAKSLKIFSWDPNNLNFERLSLKIFENNLVFKTPEISWENFLHFSKYIDARNNAADCLTKILINEKINTEIFKEVETKNVLAYSNEENLLNSQKIICEIAKLLFPQSESFQQTIINACNRELTTSAFYARNDLALRYWNSIISSIFLETAKNLLQHYTDGTSTGSSK